MFDGIIDRKKLLLEIMGTVSEVAKRAPYDPEWFDRLVDRQREIEAIVEKQPTVDAVSVVRCKNCQYSREKTPHENQYFDDDVLICESGEFAEGECAVWSDDFCSYGERKLE